MVLIYSCRSMTFFWGLWLPHSCQLSASSMHGGEGLFSKPKCALLKEHNSVSRLPGGEAAKEQCWVLPPYWGKGPGRCCSRQEAVLQAWVKQHGALLLLPQRNNESKGTQWWTSRGVSVAAHLSRPWLLPTCEGSSHPWKQPQVSTLLPWEMQSRATRARGGSSPWPRQFQRQHRAWRWDLLLHMGQLTWGSRHGTPVALPSVVTTGWP